MADWFTIEEPHDLSPFLKPLTAPPEALAEAQARGVREWDGPFAPYAWMLQPAGDGVADGVWRHPDGTLSVACTIPMAGVSADMWDWWFGWHGPSTARYRLWHPDAHKFAALAEDRSHLPPGKPRYIGNTSAVDEYIGEEFNKLAIKFLPPAEFGFDENALARRGTAICGMSWLRGKGLQVGQLCHFVENTPGGATMHSRFHLGDVTCEWPLIGSLVTPLLGIPAVRRKLQTDNFGLALLQHCFEEMNHLATFLPELHARYGDD